MKLSLDWLGQYVDIGTFSPEDVAYKLTMATAEVEEVKALTRTVKDIVVGEITEIRRSGNCDCRRDNRKGAESI